MTPSNNFKELLYEYDFANSEVKNANTEAADYDDSCKRLKIAREQLIKYVADLEKKLGVF